MVTDAPKNRWYQFSLRTLLVVMLLSCFGFAWIGWRMQRARDNRARMADAAEAVAAIEKLANTVEFEYEELRPRTWLESQFDDPGGSDDPVGVLNITIVDLGWSSVSDADLTHLTAMKSLQSLWLRNTQTTDAGLINVTGLTNLEDLFLNENQITDAGLEHLKGLTNLQCLGLGGTRITDAGLEHLRGLTNLRGLFLGKTKVSDVGLEHVKGMKGLQYLGLDRTNVTDAGLEHLKGLTNLQTLSLQETKVTDAGVQKLQQALPNCTISH